ESWAGAAGGRGGEWTGREGRPGARAVDSERLPGNPRARLRRRYTQAETVEGTAAACSRRVEAVSRALSRIRHTLHECVTRTLGGADHVAVRAVCRAAGAGRSADRGPPLRRGPRPP